MPLSKRSSNFKENARYVTKQYIVKLAWLEAEEVGHDHVRLHSNDISAFF